MPGRESALTAFSCELIEAIGVEEKLKIEIVRRSWSNLTLGLREGDYQAICSSMQPYLFYEKLYLFSDLYLATGPVLVIPIGTSYHTLSEMKGRLVGVLRNSSDALLLEKYPDIIQRTYDSIQQALDDTQQGVIDGMIIDILTAEAFVNDLYQGQLKISTPPLTSEGVRLIALHGTRPDLIQRFNRGLSRLKSNGTYKKLTEKWGLSSLPTGFAEFSDKKNLFEREPVMMASRHFPP